MVTKAWKVYGREGYRIKESFCMSYKCDFSKRDRKTRIIEVFNSDVTGTNNYTIVRITRDTAEDCEKELDGQISDGIFENQNTGHVKEININDVPDASHVLILDY